MPKNQAAYADKANIFNHPLTEEVPMNIDIHALILVRAITNYQDFC